MGYIVLYRFSGPGNRVVNNPPTLPFYCPGTSFVETNILYLTDSNGINLPYQAQLNNPFTSSFVRDLKKLASVAMMLFTSARFFSCNCKIFSSTVSRAMIL